MSILRCGNQKVHSAQDVGASQGEGKCSMLSHYQQLHDGPEYLIGFFSYHWTLSQTFLTLVNTKPSFLTRTVTVSLLFNIVNCQWWFRYFFS